MDRDDLEHYKNLTRIIHHTIPKNTPADYSGIPVPIPDIHEISCDNCGCIPHVCLTCDNKRLFKPKEILNNKEMKMSKVYKYHAIKPFNSDDVLSCAPCKEEFDLFVHQFGFYKQLTDIDIDYIVREKPVWFEWLVDRKFIEEDKPRYSLRILNQEETMKHMFSSTGKELCNLVVWDEVNNNVAGQGFLLSVNIPNEQGGPIRVLKYTGADTRGLCQQGSLTKTSEVVVETE